MTNTTITKTYEDFIRTKRIAVEPSGFSVRENDDINPNLFQWQRDIVRWSLRVGRAGLFEAPGLGKTLQQLCWADRLIKYGHARRVLILCPLAVAQQTKREADKFGIETDVKVCREGRKVASGITVTNYERLHKFDTSVFDAVVPDESSILKGLDSSTRKQLTDAFGRTPYKLCCTATPAPNDHMELGNHAEFIGAMSRSEMLSMFFVHDGGDTSKWRLRGHASTEFWKWMGSWSLMIRKPADLGYPNDGYDLPPLVWHDIVVESHGWAAGTLFAMEAKTMDERRHARRDSLADRVERAAELANAIDEPWIEWCNLNDESRALTAAIRGAIEVTGSDPVEKKEESLLAFMNGQARVLVSKPEIAGFGLNLQFCRKVAFVGLSDSWEQLHQAISRCHRFGQTRQVDAYVITGEREGAVVANIRRKQSDADRMADESVKHMADITSEQIKGVTRLVSTYKRKSEKSSSGKWEARLGDCVEGAREMKDESIDFCIHSPPFASLYVYSNSDRDMGNCRDYNEFVEHYKFLIRELYRVTQPGRLVAVHCMNLPTTIQHHGQIGIQDFRGDIIRSFVDDEAVEMHAAIQRLNRRIAGAAAAGDQDRELRLAEARDIIKADLEKHPGETGFIYHSEVCIWKDPVTAMQRTKALGLLHKQVVKDSCMSRQGIPDYLCVFRKPGVNQNPVSGEFDHFIGDPSTFEQTGKLSIDIWQRYASPIWMDIRPNRTLQYTTAREANDDLHICPLQLDVIERAMELWSKEGDLIYSPFTGIGSEGYVAVSTGRRFIGDELKESYWQHAIMNLRVAEKEFHEKSRSLFDLSELDEPASV